MTAAALGRGPGAEFVNTSGRVSASDARVVFNESVLVPARRGHRHWDTLRISEAAKAGAIPVVAGLSPDERQAVFGRYVNANSLPVMASLHNASLPHAALLHSSLAPDASRLSTPADVHGPLPPFVFLGSWADGGALRAALAPIVEDAAVQAARRRRVRRWYVDTVCAARGAIAWALAVLHVRQ